MQRTNHAACSVWTGIGVNISSCGIINNKTHERKLQMMAYGYILKMVASFGKTKSQ